MCLSQTEAIVPKGYSAIWSRIVLRDYSDDAHFSKSKGDVFNESTTVFTNKNSLVEMLSRMNVSNAGNAKRKNHLEDILSEIDEVTQCVKVDGDNLLPLNLPLLGSIFNQFLLNLSEHMVSMLN